MEQTLLKTATNQMKHVIRSMRQIHQEQIMSKHHDCLLRWSNVLNSCGKSSGHCLPGFFQGFLHSFLPEKLMCDGLDKRSGSWAPRWGAPLLLSRLVASHKEGAPGISAGPKDVDLSSQVIWTVGSSVLWLCPWWYQREWEMGSWEGKVPCRRAWIGWKSGWQEPYEVQQRQMQDLAPGKT